MANYYLVLTSHGSTQFTAAQTGTGFTITDFVLGDANGLPYLPDSKITNTTLVHERARIAVDSVTAINPDLVKVVVTIPPTIGGFNIHEIGLLDSTGQLVYIGNWTGGYRAAIGEGAEGQSVIELDIKTSGLGNVVIQLNPDFIAADQAWVDANYVRKSVYDQHIIDDDAAHDHLQDQIDAEVIARAEAVSAAITTAEDYSHAADTALAEGMQALLDAEAAARAAGDAALQAKIGAVGSTDLQTQINNLGTTVSGLYPRLIAAGNFQTQYNAGTTATNDIVYSHSPTGWPMAIDVPGGGGPSKSVSITTPSGIDLSDTSKYDIFLNGQAIVHFNYDGGSGSTRVDITDTETSTTLQISYLYTDAVGDSWTSQDRYVFTASWQVIQLKP